MERLFSPWRSKYIESFKTKTTKEDGCIFCDALASKNDKENLVVYRSREAFVIMNLYPYNSGHMMVVPNRHTAEFSSLTSSESSECLILLQTAERALTELSAPHGFNIGMNLGRAAGAGIDDHLHWHIVPRWNGDTNFMPIIADIKMVSEDMHRQRTAIEGLFAKILRPPV
ncbi:MAG TPA: HIT domain-containing protein [Candidatus Kapabacteria bacterium]|nr:HIT domain-containing protein [Candidatus Kapabacteria bacterium]